MKFRPIERAIPLGGSLAILAGLGFAISQPATSQNAMHTKPMPILFLPYSGSVAAGPPAFEVTNTGSGEGVVGVSNSYNGVHGQSASAGNSGVWGENVGGGYGVSGSSNGANAAGVWGNNSSYGGNGVLGTAVLGFGVYGQSTFYGVGGTGAIDGIYGSSDSGTGVEGVSNSYYGVVGESTDGEGVFGTSTNSTGTEGFSNHQYGVLGTNGDTQDYGLLGAPGEGVFGYGTNYATGVYGESVNGDAVFAYNTGRGQYGLLGGQAYYSLTYRAGVFGSGYQSGAYDGTIGVGLMGQGDFAGVYGVSNGQSYGGYFGGDVFVEGTFNAGNKLFKIDHPLDPANKYLNHSCIESSEYMNLYRGNVTLDANGQAIVTVPDWFEALNKNYSYQLTCVGGFAPVYIAQELQHRQFAIAGGKPGMKVCWQIMGERQDPFVKAHPLEVEQVKPEGERGLYLHPREYGKPDSMGIYQARNPAMISHAPISTMRASGLPIAQRKR